MDIKEYLTKNRKLKLEEYDNNGTLIDVIEFSDDDLYSFCSSMANSYDGFKIAPINIRNHFTGDKLYIFQKLRWAMNWHYYITDKEVQVAEELFNEYTMEQIKFTLDFKDPLYGMPSYNFSLKIYHDLKSMNFMDTLKFVKNNHGFWYAVSNNGDRGMAYLEEPTKKQAQYQRTKNGMRIVYLSFKDFTEYLVEENELK